MTQRRIRSVVAGWSAALLVITPLSSFAANGDLVWGPVAGEEVGISRILKGLAFTITTPNSFYVGGSKEETSGGPLDMVVEMRSASDGSLDTAFDSDGYAIFGSTGENDILSAVLSTRAVTAATQYVYLVSFNENDNRSEITLINQETGAQDNRSVTDTGVRYYTAIAGYDRSNDDTALYVAGTNALGNWIVQRVKPSCACVILSQDLTFTPTIAGRPYAITQDDEYLYVGGYSVSGTNEQWHVEKIRKSDFARMWAGGVDIDFSNVSGAGVIDDAITAMAVNENGIFLGGYDSGWDDVARWSVRRINENGASTWSKNANASMPLGEIRSIAVDAYDLYVGGRDEASAGWRIEKRDGETGDIDTGDGFGGGSGVVAENQGSGEYVAAAAYDGNALYVAGNEGSTTQKWLIEKRQVTAPAISCSFTAETPANLSRTVKDFSASAGYICSDGGCANGDTTGPFAVGLPQGKYEITVRSYDDHYKVTTRPETKEQWKLTLTDVNGTDSVLSLATGDLPEYRAYSEDSLTSNDTLVSAGIDFASMVHAFTGSSNGNSVLPACIAFDRYPQCDDHVDNDGDGKKDIDDDACHIDGDANDGDNTYDSTIDDEDRTLPACSNAFDDDGDGKIDYGPDVGCTDYFDTSEVNPECSDGVDNGDAEDALVDAADPGCHVNNDLDQPYNPFDYNETDSVSSGALQCGDAVDNDGDGFIDTADIGCSGTDDVSEFNVLRFRES